MSSAAEEENIQVVIRVRPADAAEGGRLSCVAATTHTTIKLDSHPKDFTFDRIIDHTVDQVQQEGAEG